MGASSVCRDPGVRLPERIPRCRRQTGQRGGLSGLPASAPGASTALRKRHYRHCHRGQLGYITKLFDDDRRAVGAFVLLANRDCGARAELKLTCARARAQIRQRCDAAGGPGAPEIA